MALHDPAGGRSERAARAAHELALHQPGIYGSAGNVIKVSLRIEQQSFAWRQVGALQHSGNSFMHAGENLLQRCRVEALFVLEIVIEQGLVDAGAAGNLISTCSGNAFMSE